MTCKHTTLTIIHRYCSNYKIHYYNYCIDCNSIVCCRNIHIINKKNCSNKMKTE